MLKLYHYLSVSTMVRGIVLYFELVSLMASSNMQAIPATTVPAKVIFALLRRPRVISSASSATIVVIITVALFATHLKAGALA